MINKIDKKSIYILYTYYHTFYKLFIIVYNIWYVNLKYEKVLLYIKRLER